MSKHTPGPWRYLPTHWTGGTINLGERNCVYIEQCNGPKRIAFLNHPSNTFEHYGSPTEEDYANARLIAAAPALLEACKIAWNELLDWNCGDDTASEAQGLLQAAIKLAETE